MTAAVRPARESAPQREMTSAAAESAALPETGRSSMRSTVSSGMPSADSSDRRRHELEGRGVYHDEQAQLIPRAGIAKAHHALGGTDPGGRCGVAEAEEIRADVLRQGGDNSFVLPACGEQADEHRAQQAREPCRRAAAL